MRKRSVNCLRGVLAFMVVAIPMPQETLACSVERVPTAVEIVDQAEVIVRVKATGFQRHDKDGGLLEFEVKEVLKGEFKASTLALPGTIDRYGGPNDNRPPYDFVRPGGRRGSCHAEDYKLGAEFLLLLKDGSPYWAPLAATNEEVTGADDPWEWWVKGYLAGKRSGTPTAKTAGR